MTSVQVYVTAQKLGTNVNLLIVEETSPVKARLGVKLGEAIELIVAVAMQGSMKVIKPVCSAVSAVMLDV